MLLNEITTSDDLRIIKINDVLKETYGFTLVSEIESGKLNRLYTKISDDLYNLKLNLASAKDSTYMQKLLVLEGLKMLIEKNNMRLEETAIAGRGDRAFDRIVANLARYVGKACDIGDDYDTAIADAMRAYKIQPYRFEEDVIEYELRKLTVDCDPLAECGGGMMYEELEERSLDIYADGNDQQRTDYSVLAMKAVDRLIKRLNSQRASRALRMIKKAISNGNQEQAADLYDDYLGDDFIEIIWTFNDNNEGEALLRYLEDGNSWAAQSHLDGLRKGDKQPDLFAKGNAELKLENDDGHIALDHLNELPDYYDRLEKMEESNRSTKYADMPYDPERSEKNDKLIRSLIRKLKKDRELFPEVKFDGEVARNVSGAKVKKHYGIDLADLFDNEWEYRSKSWIDSSMQRRVFSIGYDKNIREGTRPASNAKLKESSQFGVYRKSKAQLDSVDSDRHAEQDWVRGIKKKKAKIAGDDELELSLAEPEDDNDDYFAHMANKTRKTEMKEGYVKQLRKLLEAEVDQAESLIAAKSFSQELQDMVEKLGRLVNEDLPAVADQMRDSHGADVATGFQDTVSETLNSIMDSLRGSKQELDNSVSSIADGGMPPVSNDMDEFSDEELGGEDELDLDSDIELDLDDAELDDEFGGEELGDVEEPLGRAKKESIQILAKKIQEQEEKLARIKAIK